MNTQANLKAIGDRLGGKAPSRFRAAAMAGLAGAGAAVAVYKLMRDADD